MAVVYLGLGSNLEPATNLRTAAQQLRLRFSLCEISSVYQSAALGFVGDDFLNAVACIETPLDPQALNLQIEQIHAVAGRQRGDTRYRSRSLDIDLLLYDRLCIDAPPIRLPRPDVLSYPFVLRPLAEIAPDYCHPQTGRTLQEHWQEFDASTHPLIAVDIEL